MAKIIITYSDGSEQIVDSFHTSWKINTDGPIRYGPFFQGEVYDANKEEAVEGWTISKYDDTAWKK